MKEEKQFLVDLQHESNKIPETNKNFDGEYIARIYGGGCVPYTLVDDVKAKEYHEKHAWVIRYIYWVGMEES